MKATIAIIVMAQVEDEAMLGKLLDKTLTQAQSRRIANDAMRSGATKIAATMLASEAELMLAAHVFSMRAAEAEMSVEDIATVILEHHAVPKATRH